MYINVISTKNYLICINIFAEIIPGTTGTKLNLRIWDNKND